MMRSRNVAKKMGKSIFKVGKVQNKKEEIQEPKKPFQRACNC